MTKRPAERKIVDRTRAAEMIARWRSRGEVSVLAIGTFDLLHIGHVRHLTGARAQGSRLIVGVCGDDSAAGLKGTGRPVARAIDRATVVAALRVVDAVVVYPERNPARLLQDLRPDVYAAGPGEPETELPEGTRRAFVPGDAGTQGLSITGLIERIRARRSGH